MTDGLRGGETEQRRPPSRTTLIILVGVALTVAAAGAAGRGSFRKGQTHEMALGLGAGVASGIIVLLAIGGLVALVVALLRAIRDRPEEIDFSYRNPSIPRWVIWAMLGLLAAFVGGVVWLIVHAKRAKYKPNSSGASSASQIFKNNKGHVSAATYHEWVVSLVVVLGVALLVTVGVVVWRRWLRHRWLRTHERLVAPAERDTATVLVEAMLDDLDAETDPRRAIVGAYRRMERVLGERDMGREPAEAPLEWLGRVFDRLNLVGEPVTRLVHLFELAVFSQRPLGASDRQEAIGALQRLSDGFRPLSASEGFAR